MADVFVSYAREDADSAATVVRALIGADLSVWYDLHTPTASRWSDVIKRELEQARCVLMLWSEHARVSRWVRREGKVGLERAVLVPVRITEGDVPEVFGRVQFADLTAWDGDPAAPEFTELLQCIRRQMLPRCQVAFESLFELRHDDLKALYEACLHIASRLGCVPVPGHFHPPASRAAGRRLHRAVASLQVSIQWPPVLTRWYTNSPQRLTFLDSVARIERHIPLLWLRLLAYSGPFFDSVSSPRTHANFLRFASLMFFCKAFFAAELAGESIDIPTPLTEIELNFSRWEEAMSVVFSEPDDVVMTYVTHIDGSPLPMEEVIYGPKCRSQIAYGKSLRGFPFTDPVWLEQYMIPQRELRLALDGSSQHTEYGGNVRIRKVTDLSGTDLQPLYD